MNIIEAIINSTDITRLLRELSVFLDQCGIVTDDKSILCDNFVTAVDTKVNTFVAEEGKSTSNYYVFDTAESPLFLLHSYLHGAESSEEIIQSISEFICNCSGIEEANCTNECEDIQNSEMEVVDLCEQKCGFANCVTAEKPLFLLPISSRNADMPYFVRENEKSNVITLFNNGFEHHSLANCYLGESLGNMLYLTVFKHLPNEYIFDKLCSVNPVARNHGIGMAQKKFVKSFIYALSEKNVNESRWNYFRGIIKTYMQFLSKRKIE